MTKEQGSDQASHRDHPLRRVQSTFERHIPYIVGLTHRIGWMKGTPVEEVLTNGGDLHPDHLTLTGLHITLEASESLVHGVHYTNVGRLILGGVLDAADGALARYLEISSPEGAVKDVLADRIAENFMAHLIAVERSKFPGGSTDLEEKLKVAFQLSTLTKASSEMFGVNASEGGRGGMIERRRVLLSVLYNLGKLNQKNNPDNQIGRNGKSILSGIDKRTDLLTAGSELRAKERIEIIKQAGVSETFWQRPELQDPSTSAAVETRKYATIVLMNESVGINIVDHLNSLVDGVEFPSFQELRSGLQYVDECVKDVEGFLAHALTIAGF